MNSHVIAHAVVAVGAVAFIVAPWLGRTSVAPISARAAMIVAGVAGLGWSVVGLYLLRHTGDQPLSHTTLSWSQFWLLDHIKTTLGGAAIGGLICLLANPAVYKLSASGTDSV